MQTSAKLLTTLDHALKGIRHTKVSSGKIHNLTQANPKSHSVPMPVRGSKRKFAGLISR
jgi:hypothetical protein